MPRNEYRDLGNARAFIREFLEKTCKGSDCIPRWATCRPLGSNEVKRMPLRGSFLYEFS